MAKTSNYSGMAKGPCSDSVSAMTAPSGEGKDAWKQGNGGQTSGKVKHGRDKVNKNVENMSHMPKNY